MVPYKQTVLSTVVVSQLRCKFCVISNYKLSLYHTEHSISMREMSWLMLCRDTVTVYYEKCTEPIHTLFTPNGLYNDSHALKSWTLHMCIEGNLMYME